MSEVVKEIQERTLIPVESCKFTWSIENFSFSGLAGEEFITSPIFTTGPSLSPTWCLRLYPNTVNNETKDGCYIGIFLTQNSRYSSDHYVFFEISIIDSNQTKSFSRQLECTFNEFRITRGFIYFLSRKSLFGADRELYLPQNVLTVMCELKVSRVDRCHCFNSTKVVKKTDFSPTVLKKPDSLVSDLQQLYDAKMYTDLILRVGEVEFQVHKIILCARSSVFNTMLNTDMKEKHTNCVEITDFDPLTVKKMLNYIYSGEVDDLTYEITYELYAAAEKYNLQGLKDICIEFLSRNLDVDNFCDALSLGALHNESELMTVIRIFFSANVAAIKQTERWITLSKTNPDLVIAMYEVILSKIII